MAERSRPEVHHSQAAADTLRARIKRELHWNARVPEFLERVNVAGVGLAAGAPAP